MSYLKPSEKDAVIQNQQEQITVLFNALSAYNTATYMVDIPKVMEAHVKGVDAIHSAFELGKKNPQPPYYGKEFLKEMSAKYLNKRKKEHEDG